jgi:hypothetical protein
MRKTLKSSKAVQQHIAGERGKRSSRRFINAVPALPEREHWAWWSVDRLAHQHYG